MKPEYSSAVKVPTRLGIELTRWSEELLSGSLTIHYNGGMVAKIERHEFVKLRAE